MSLLSCIGSARNKGCGVCVANITPQITDVNSLTFSGAYNEECNYKTIWDTEGGRIVISPTYFNFNYYIVCAYVDEQNVKALRQTIINDI